MRIVPAPAQDAGCRYPTYVRERELLTNLWNRASSRNVGGHWPTKVLQSRLPASQSVADAAMEAIAAQYQADWGMLSVIVKYSFCAVSTREVSIGALL